MKFIVLILVFASLYLDSSESSNVNNQKKGKTWAVLLTGPPSYVITYAHEAGIYRMYQLLVEGGVSPDNIITISSDVAPWIVENPLSGVVVHGEKFLHNYTRDYYLDVNIDYWNSHYLNSSQILGIFSGDTTLLKGVGTERVVKSGPDDNIIFYQINFSSYGWSFTNTFSEYFDAEELIPFIEDLKQKKRFNKFMYIFDTTNSGSFFDDYLETDQSIYALTNTGRYERMKYCHFNEQSTSYTSTCFSYGLLTYLEHLVKLKKINGQSIFDLFYAVRTLTKKFAQMNIYGDLKTSNTKITDFFGEFKSNTGEVNGDTIKPLKNMDHVSSGSTTTHLINHLRSSIKTTITDEETRRKISDEIDNISLVLTASSRTFDAIVAKVFNGTEYDIDEAYESNFRVSKDQMECVKTTRNTAFKHCFPEQNAPVVLDFMSVLPKMCSMGIDDTKIIESMKSVCNKQSQPILVN